MLNPDLIYSIYKYTECDFHRTITQHTHNSSNPENPTITTHISSVISENGPSYKSVLQELSTIFGGKEETLSLLSHSDLWVIEEM